MAPPRSGVPGSASGRGSNRSRQPSRRSARIRSQSPAPSPGANQTPRAASTSGRAGATGSTKATKLFRVATLAGQAAQNPDSYKELVGRSTDAESTGRTAIRPTPGPSAGTAPIQEPIEVPNETRSPHRHRATPTVSPSPTSRSKGNSNNSVSSNTKKLIKTMVKDHLKREVTPQLANLQRQNGELREELLTSTVEAQQALQDEIDNRLGSQADVALSIAQREAKTRVDSLMSEARASLEASLLELLRAEVPPMVRMSLATAPVSLEEGQTREDLRALTQSLAEERARVKVLEGRMDLCFSRREAQPEYGRRSPPPRGTRHRYDKQSRSRRRHRSISDSEMSEEENLGKMEVRHRHSRSCSRSCDHRSDHSDDEKDHAPYRSRQWQGPKDSRLKEIIPGDPRFRRVLSYRTYRLRNTDGNRGPDVAYNTGANTRRVAHVMGTHTFDGSDPISILSFLARFKQQMDHNKLSEGAACLICPNFLAGDAKEAYENNFELPADEGGFNSWSEAVQFLLKSYAKDRHIEEALATLDDIRQMPSEKEGDYAKRLRKQARRCGGVFNEAELITRFIRGLNEDLKPLLRLLRADYSLPNAFQDYVERAAAQGDAHRALVNRDSKSTRTPAAATPCKLVKRPDKSTRPTRHVFQVDTAEEHMDDLPYVPPPTADANAAPVMVTHHHDVLPSYTPTEELDPPQTDDTDRSVSFDDEVYLIHPNRNARLPYYAQPTPHQRPGWLTFRNEPSDICFECFGLGHKKPNCPHLAKTFYDANYRELVKRNYQALTRQQKDYLHAVGRTPAFALANPPLAPAMVPPSVPSTPTSDTLAAPQVLQPARGPPRPPRSPRAMDARPPRPNPKN